MKSGVALLLHGVAVCPSVRNGQNQIRGCVRLIIHCDRSSWDGHQICQEFRRKRFPFIDYQRICIRIRRLSD